MGVVVVPAVDLVEVDVVGSQAPQARVDLVEDRLARQALRRSGPARIAPADLGRDDDVVAPREVPQRAAGDLLAGAGGVDVGRVEEVDARARAARLKNGRASSSSQRPLPAAALAGHGAAGSP